MLLVRIVNKGYMRKLLLSIVLGLLVVNVSGSVLDTKPKGKPRPVYILRLGEDRAIKTKIVRTLRHSMVYSGSTLDSNFVVFNFSKTFHNNNRRPASI